MSRRDLTPRELQVLAHAAQGYQDKAIAKILGIGHETVKEVMSRVLIKLDGANRTDASVKAVRAGLI